MPRTLPLQQQETWTYGVDGQVATHVDFNHHQTDYTYGAGFGRLSLVHHATMPAFSYTYCPGGARRTARVAGQNTLTYAYEGLVDDATCAVDTSASAPHVRGWLHSVTQHSDADLYHDETLTYDHDASGNVTARTTHVDNGGAVATATYSYDAENRLWQVFDATSSSVPRAAYGYLPDGLPATLTYANGVQATYTPDVAGRMKDIEWTKPTTGGGTQTLASFNWTGTSTNPGIDAGGRRVHVAEAGGKTVDYQYDDNDRLTQEQDAATSNTTNYLWNDDGDLTEKDGPDGQTTYTWDAEDRLVSANVPGHALSFAYDAEGIRQSTTLDGATTNFLVDGNRPYAQVLEEHGPSRNLRFVLGDRRLAELQRSVSGTQQHWLITDSLGTVRGLADVGATSLSDTYDYEAFGSPLSATGSTLNDFRFTGEQWQPEIGMEYLRARWMQPSAGRLVSADRWPQGQLDPSRLQAYNYVANRPQGALDPTGHSEVEAAVAVQNFASASPSNPLIVPPTIGPTSNDQVELLEADRQTARRMVDSALTVVGLAQSSDPAGCDPAVEITRRWFGPDFEDWVQQVKMTLNGMSNAIPKLQFNVSAESSPNDVHLPPGFHDLAYTHGMCVDIYPAFWSYPVEKQNPALSQSQVIVHESTHAGGRSIVGTGGQEIYPYDDCLALAVDFPELAVRNGNNYAFFAVDAYFH